MKEEEETSIFLSMTTRSTSVIITKSYSLKRKLALCILSWKILCIRRNIYSNEEKVEKYLMRKLAYRKYRHLISSWRKRYLALINESGSSGSARLAAAGGWNTTPAQPALSASAAAAAGWKQLSWNTARWHRRRAAQKPLRIGAAQKAKKIAEENGYAGWWEEKGRKKKTHEGRKSKKEGRKYEV